MVKRKEMTATESRVYNIIVDEPMISQKNLAIRAGISRSAASVHISSLVSKGYIAGRGYMINEIKDVVIVGAAMVDLFGESFYELKQGSQDPGKIRINPGGVGRNIAENLMHMEMKVNLVTSLCNDPFGNLIKENLEEIGVDYSHSYFLDHESSTLFMAMLDPKGNYRYAVSDTRSLNKMPLDHIIRKDSVFSHSQLIIIDASIPNDLVEYITNKYDKQQIILDPISPIKAKNMKSIIGGFDAINCNVEEASILSDIEITDQKSLEKAGYALLTKGLEKVFISLNEHGVYYQDKNESGLVPSFATEILNVTGASDAFTAGIAYGITHDYPIRDIAEFASAAASIAVEDTRTVSPNLDLKEIEKRLKSR